MRLVWLKSVRFFHQMLGTTSLLRRAKSKDPQSNIPLSLALGTGLVICLYILANFAYLSTLSLQQIQTAPDDRVATAALNVIFGGIGATIMAVAIVISTFGCNNGLILAGARVYYAMAKDNLFFKSVGNLSSKLVPAVALDFAMRLVVSFSFTAHRQRQ